MCKELCSWNQSLGLQTFDLCIYLGIFCIVKNFNNENIFFFFFLLNKLLIFMRLKAGEISFV